VNQKVATGVSTTLIVSICFLIAALEGYDIQAFGVAAPTLVPELGLNPGQQGWAASAAMFGLVAGAFGGGWLSDRTGRKPVLIASVLLFGLCSIWTAFTHDYVSLMTARFVTGLGFGGALPNLIAIASEISSPKRRASTTSAMFCGMPAGGAVVALAARIAGDALDWRTIFIIGGALPLIVVPLIYFLLPETKPPLSGPREKRLIGELFGQGRATPTLLLWAANLLTLVVLYLMLNWLPSLIVAKGHESSDGATASLAFNLLGIVGALALGFIVDKVGFRWSLAATYIGLAIAMTLLGAVTPIGPVVALCGAAGFLVLGAQYALYGLAPRLYDPAVRAAGAGAAIGFGRFGSIIGPLIAGEMRQAGLSADQVLGAMLPVVLLAGLCVFVLTYKAKDRLV